MNVRTFTEEDRRWLKANYPSLKKNECMAHLKCGRVAFTRLMEECGFEYKKSADSNPKPQKEKKYAWQDAGCQRVCQECYHYRKGGVCSDTGKVIGALWKKKCFRPKDDQ